MTPDIYADIERHGFRQHVGRITRNTDFGDFVKIEVLKPDGSFGETHMVNPKGIACISIVSYSRAKQIAQFRAQPGERVDE